jgi:hypothetical protein
MDAHHEINRRKTVVKRAIVVAISVILVLTMAVPTVLARSDNGKAPEPVSADFIVMPGDPGGSCDFPIRLQVSGKGKTITLPNGSRIITSPGLFVTVTNLATPENQTTLNITGTFHESTAANGDVTTRITGRNLPFDPEAGVNLTIGNFSFVFDAEGNLLQSFEQTDGKGQVIDVCALLA